MNSRCKPLVIIVAIYALEKIKDQWGQKTQKYTLVVIIEGNLQFVQLNCVRVQERARFTFFIFFIHLFITGICLASRPLWYYSCTKERVWQTKNTGWILGCDFFFLILCINCSKCREKLHCSVNEGENFFGSCYLTRKANLKPVRHVFKRWWISSFSCNSLEAKRSYFRCFIQVGSTLDNILVSLVDQHLAL